MKKTLSAAALALMTQGALAGPADVVDAKAHCDRSGECRIDVTVRHADQGWGHYADRWEVLGADGEVLTTRVLLHPHDTEQPFTRSLGGLRLPRGTTQVRIRAHDSMHGYGGQVFTLTVGTP